jgi:hypothetical protein
MESKRWAGWRWVLLVLVAGLFFTSLGLFNYYRQVDQIKQTGQPVTVLVIAKERGGGRSPNEVIALHVKQKIRISTRSQPFFSNSVVGQLVTVLKRPDIDLYVPSTEPTTRFFCLIVAIWGVVVMLAYGILTKRIT